MSSHSTPVHGFLRRGRGPARHQARWAYILLAPFFLFFVVFLVVPIGFSLLESMFTDKRSGLGLGPTEHVFVGLANYARALADPSLGSGVGRLSLYVVVVVPVLVVVALALALLIDAGIGRIGSVYRLIIFLPFAVPGVIAALMWGYLYEPQLSPFLQWLAAVGVHVNPLASDSLIPGIANISVWEVAGYNMIIFIAALQAIHPTLYEAAALDGAGRLRVAFQIKLPLIAPAIVLAALFGLVGSLQLFNEPLILSPLAPAIGADYTPNLYAYSTAFARNDYTYGSTLATLIAVVTIVISFVFLRVFKRRAGLGDA